MSRASSIESINRVIGTGKFQCGGPGAAIWDDTMNDTVPQRLGFCGSPWS